MSCLVSLVKAWSGGDRHLDADEAVVLGAGLFAANLSTTFRLRKFGMTDGVTFPLMFQVIRLPHRHNADSPIRPLTSLSVKGEPASML